VGGVAVQADTGMRIAAIDIGSNSIHMVVAHAESDGRFRVLDRAKEMVQLGRRTLSTGRLPAESMDAGVRTLVAFHTLAVRQGVTRFKVVATSAVREASNGGDFVRRVHAATGLHVKVIPGREEARLIYQGVRQAIDLRDAPTLIVDAGGGSVELIVTDADAPAALHSLKLGVARLCEQFLRDDPPGPKALGRLSAHLAAQLDPVLERHTARGIRRVVGTSGTLLNLIAVAGHLRGTPPDGHLNHFSVGAAEVSAVRRLVGRLDRAERLRIKGLDAKRVDLIIPGAYLADHILRSLGAAELTACTWALREGVLIDFIARHRRGIAEVERFADPRRRSVARFARHLGEEGPHGPQVARLALRLFDQLAEPLRLPPEARDWLEFAALLHDVGHHISHHQHHRHSYYLIANGDLLGFRREEIEVIALVARYHRKGPPKRADPEYGALPAAAQHVVRGLSALLRVADALDRSHYGVVRDVTVRRRGARLVLELRTDGDDAALELWDARERIALLRRLLGHDVTLRTGGGAAVLTGERGAAAARVAAKR
jgi:exopolyphosphatase/guanosine-5'-triphosphate,3'-diphosphate pyrophosphatase